MTALAERQVGSTSVRNRTLVLQNSVRSMRTVLAPYKRLEPILDALQAHTDTAVAALEAGDDTVYRIALDLFLVDAVEGMAVTSNTGNLEILAKWYARAYNIALATA